MAGWEGRCNDWHDDNYYRSSPYYNPHDPASGTYRVLRGGSWYGNFNSLRCAVRNYRYPVNRFADIGFRLLRKMPL